MKNKHREIVLPALRGIMGDWVYYSCLMNLGELSSRVRFAEEIHKSKKLSDMIQRSLRRTRGAQIAEYLKKQPERLFNSLVVATYGGQPNWHALSDVRCGKNAPELEGLHEEIISSVGFLALRGDEQLFALDGQHRLAGIKKAVKDGVDNDPFDEVTVLFVEHQDNSKGLERTRRLFTALNKTTRPVSKGDIIALDEDDVMALCVRHVIDESALFADERIAFVASNNMPVANTKSLTTIGNLYDVYTLLFTGAKSELQARKQDLQRFRPSDEKLDKYFAYARELFVLFENEFAELGEFFSATDTAPVVEKYRGSHGGNALFRPIGLEIFVRIVARLTKDRSLAQSVKLAARLPRTLTDEPFAGLLWDPRRKTILNGNKVTLREVLLYMLGKNDRKYSEAELLERYRRDTGDETAELPKKLI
ncbi:MAG: DGQHR domain-containing protein [Albidovulum sp.]|nr:DGQHR domain-containing protein [Albidovulum sp.]